MQYAITIAECPLQIPIEILPPRMLSKTALVSILLKLIPTWESFKLSKAIHALRLWGPDATFGDPLLVSPYHTKIFTGKELLSLFLDHRQYIRLVRASSPILHDTDEGIIVRYKSIDKGFEGDIAHVDKLLRVCGELGVPSNIWIRTPDRETTLREIIRGAVSNFDAGQELEWTTEAFARYLQDTKAWTNRFHQTFSFDNAIDTLIKKGEGKSPCFGTHLPYILVVIYRLNEIRPFLSRESKEKIRNQVGQISTELDQSQKSDGSWPIAWSERVMISPEVKRNEDPVIDLILRLTVLGHHLEWMGIAPIELRPSDMAIQKAIDYAVASFHRIPPAIVEDQYHTLTHLGKALCGFAGVLHTKSYRLLREHPR